MDIGRHHSATLRWSVDQVTQLSTKTAWSCGAIICGGYYPMTGARSATPTACAELALELLSGLGVFMIDQVGDASATRWRTGEGASGTGDGRQPVAMTRCCPRAAPADAPATCPTRPRDLENRTLLLSFLGGLSAIRLDRLRRRTGSAADRRGSPGHYASPSCRPCGHRQVRRRNLTASKATTRLCGFCAWKFVWLDFRKCFGYSVGMLDENVEKSARGRFARTGRPRSLPWTMCWTPRSILGWAAQLDGARGELGVGTRHLHLRAQSGRAGAPAAVRHAKRPRFDDLGQHWSDLVRGHAERTFALCSRRAQLLVQHMSGLNGPDMHVDYSGWHAGCAHAPRSSPCPSLSLYSRPYDRLRPPSFALPMSARCAVRAMGRGRGAPNAASMALDALPHVRACEDFAE